MEETTLELSHPLCEKSIRNQCYIRWLVVSYISFCMEAQAVQIFLEDLMKRVKEITLGQAFGLLSDPGLYEPAHEKTNNLHMRKQRHRSAAR